MGCHFLLQGIFPTQGLNLCLLNCRWILDSWATLPSESRCLRGESDPTEGPLCSYQATGSSSDTLIHWKGVWRSKYTFREWGNWVQFSRSVVSDSLQPREPQHARPPCPSPTPGVYPNLCPSSRWCHPAISSSVVPFSSCPQSLAASGSFPMSQLFTWGGQSIGVPASASVLPMNTQDWSPSGWTGWISFQSKGLSRVRKLYSCYSHCSASGWHMVVHN